MNTKSSMTRSRSNSEVHCCCSTGGDDCEEDDDDGDDASAGGTILMMGTLASGDVDEDDDVDGDDVNIDVDSGGSCDEEVSLVMSWFSFRKCCFNICRSVDTSRHSKSSLLYVIESTYMHTYMGHRVLNRNLSIYIFIFTHIYLSIHLSIDLSIIYLSIYHLSFHHLSSIVYPSIHPSSSHTFVLLPSTDLLSEQHEVWLVCH